MIRSHEEARDFCQSEIGSQTKGDKGRQRPSRKFIRSLHGKYRGQGLMEELLEEKKLERDR